MDKTATALNPVRMDHSDAENFVREIYSALLAREPRGKELEEWIAKAQHSSPAFIVSQFRKSKEYLRKQGVKTFVPAGHYYSPIVDPEQLSTEYYNRERAQAAGDIEAMTLDVDRMTSLWKAWTATLASTDFKLEPTSGTRFHLNNGMFPFGDAAVLRATIAERAPKRIIEIGSGHSTACMLDSVEEFGLDTEIVCIEPDAARLKSICRANDLNRLTLLEKPVQQVPLDVYRQLKAGDILFIDSTHVVKTASDVHHEFFHILPMLEDGVLVHFHDCPFPFEYPPNWIFKDNMSWNEVYFLRAFLMYNKRFTIRFWTTMFHKTCPDLIKQTIPRMCDPPLGSGVWLACGADNRLLTRSR